MRVGVVRRFAGLLAVLAFAALLTPVPPAVAQTVTVGNVQNLVVTVDDDILKLSFDALTPDVEEVCARHRVKDANPDEDEDQPGSWMPTDDGRCLTATFVSTRGFDIPLLTYGTTYQVEVSTKNKDDVSSGWTASGEGTPSPLVYLTTSSETVTEGDSVTITAVLA